jgi:hypothetical protein
MQIAKIRTVADSNRYSSFCGVISRLVVSIYLALLCTQKTHASRLLHHDHKQDLTMNNQHAAVINDISSGDIIDKDAKVNDILCENLELRPSDTIPIVYHRISFTIKQRVSLLNYNQI